VFVGSPGRRRHGIAPCRRQYIIHVHKDAFYVHCEGDGVSHGG
jgi:hypothetical protein